MKKWLAARNIQFDLQDTKLELYAKINLNRLVKEFAIDKLLADHGHVLRLPPYHPELNPIEKIWALMKNHVHDRILPLKWIMFVTLRSRNLKISHLRSGKKICQHSRKIENEYLERECLLDDFNDLIINLEDTSGDKSDSEFDDHRQYIIILVISH